MKFVYTKKSRLLAMRDVPVTVYGRFTSVYQVLNFITLLEYFEGKGFEYEAFVRFSNYWGRVDESIFETLSKIYRVNFIFDDDDFESAISIQKNSNNIVEVKLNSSKMLPWKNKTVFVIDEGIGVFRTSAVKMYRSWARECAANNKPPSMSLIRYVIFFHFFRFRDYLFGGIRFSMVERRLRRFHKNNFFLSCYRSVIEKLNNQVVFDLGNEIVIDKPCFIFLTAPFIYLGILNQNEVVDLYKKVEHWCDSKGCALLIKPHPADDFRSEDFHFLRPEVPAEFYFQRLKNTSGVIGFSSTSLLTAKVVFDFDVYNVEIDNLAERNYLDPGIASVLNNFSTPINLVL